MRPFCKICNKNYAANNYTKNGVRHYRSKCESCIKRNRKLTPSEPRWKKDGYKKKATCDLCGFKAIYSSQTIVYHIDGNLNNTQFINLRTICLNCIETVKRRNITWRPGDIQLD